MQNRKTPIFLLEVYKHVPTRPIWKAERTKNYHTHNGQDLANTKKFAATRHNPFPFSIKNVWILTWVKWFFGKVVHHLLSLLALQIKLLWYSLPQSLISFISLMACHAKSSISMNLVTLLVILYSVYQCLFLHVLFYILFQHIYAYTCFL